MSHRSRSLALLAPLIAALVVTPTALGSITPEAAKVLDRYVGAIGGRAAVEAERSAHIRSTVKA
ncbi:MAG: hypothetical protein ACRENJ_10380, partial [Candidatus Eiseniibacteriota bacterium]